ASLALAATLVGVGFTYAPSAAQAHGAPVGSGIERLMQASPSPTPGTRPGRPMDPGQRQQFIQQRQQQQQAFLNAVASHLGVSPDALQAAMKQARIDQINQAVKDGKLDQTRANQIIQAIQNGQGFMGPGGPEGGRPGFQGGPDMRGPAVFAAQAIGLTPDQ